MFSGACAVLGMLACSIQLGCRSQPEPSFTGGDYPVVSTQIEYPDAQVATVSAEEMVPPHTLREPTPESTWRLSLEEAVQIAVQNSQVMREIGARVIASPQAMSTVYDPALQQTDPRLGEEAALSAFDAQFATSLLLDQDDRAFNNPLFAGAGVAAAAASVTSENNVFQAQVSKVAATGTRFALSNNTTRVSRTTAFELFPSYYETLMQAEVRHPLLRGGGLAFNRIAGPNGSPGNYNGILIARIRTDVALADFERAVRDLVEDVQQTYWQLYFAYRNFDARVAARDAALESWRTADAQRAAGQVALLEESLAREQYYQLQTQVADALSGIGTDTSTSPGVVGIYSIERRLRLLMGVEVNDGQLIRPSDEPLRAEVVFDWNEAMNRAFFRRVELRRQRWNIEQREMELAAAQNQLMMRLDLVGQYRWRGFGDELLGERKRLNGSAFANLWDGNLQGWQVGLELSTPIGNRIAHAAVRNAQLVLSRERALLEEQKRHIQAEMADAFNERDRAYLQAKNNFNRVLAARQRLSAEENREESGQGILQFVLEAQSRVADAQAEYFRSLVNYNLAVAKIHYAQGTLLDYMGVRLTEGPWSEQAHRSAAKESTRFARRHLIDCVSQPSYVSQGAYQQSVLQPGHSASPDAAQLGGAGDAAQAEKRGPAPAPLDAPMPNAPDRSGLGRLPLEEEPMTPPAADSAKSAPDRRPVRLAAPEPSID